MGSWSGGSVNPNCPIHGNGGGSYNPNCPIHGSQAGGQPGGNWTAPPLEPIEPIVRTQPANPPIAKKEPPATPTIDRSQIDEIVSRLTVELEQQLSPIAQQGLDNAAAIEVLQGKVAALEEKCGNCKQPNLDELVKAVIAKLPPRRFQAKTPDGKPFGDIVVKGWTAKDDDILYLQSVIAK
jgi:hypothetical protein